MVGKKIKIAICEDEKAQAMEFKRIIEEMALKVDLKNENISLLINIYHTGEDLKNSSNEYDIILQDVDLGEDRINGYDVAKWINIHCEIEPFIIILTGLEDQAEASNEFGVKASGFIKKGTGASAKIKETVLKFIKLSIDVKGITVKVVKKGEMSFQYNSIRFISKDGNETYVHLTDGTSHPTHLTLTEWKKQLCDKQFYLVHKSNIVNLDFIIEFSDEKDQVILRNQKLNEEIKIAKEKYKKITYAWMIYRKNKIKRGL